MPTTELCPNLLGKGICSTPDCPFSHTTFSCDVCKVFTPTQFNLDQHLNSKRHKAALQGNKFWECWICNVRQGNKPPWDSYQFHEKTLRHRTRVAALAGSSATQQTNKEIRCEACKADVRADLWSVHCNSVSHKKKEKFLTYETALQDAAKDKGGVVVREKELDFGTVELATLQTQPTRIQAFNITTQRKVKLCEARVTSSVGTYAHLRESKCVPFFFVLSIRVRIKRDPELIKPLSSLSASLLSLTQP